MDQKKIALVWGKWGPYHHARFNALVRAWGEDRCIGIALAGKSSNYQWAEVRESGVNGRLFTLNPDADQETLSPFRTGRQVYSLLKKEKVDVAFMPGYWPARALSIVLFARLAGVRCVMMNESHAATEKARGPVRWGKKQLLRLFGAGLVGGTPHIQHFASLGMPKDKLFPGYDAVDNDYFAQTSDLVRNRGEAIRAQLGLPERYILNLGRMVPKKNLSLLIDAYARLSADGGKVALVLIGSGPLEDSLKAQAIRSGLTVRSLEPGSIPTDTAGAVYFGGFRQIEENPAFYALADVFVLPSHTEEWGLVVNEAMACGLPILVSQNVGAASDLVEDAVNGFRFDPTDTDALSERLRELLSNAPLRTDMGKASRHLIGSWGCDAFARNALKAADRC